VSLKGHISVVLLYNIILSFCGTNMLHYVSTGTAQELTCMSAHQQTVSVDETEEMYTATSTNTDKTAFYLILDNLKHSLKECTLDQDYSKCLNLVYKVDDQSFARI